MITDHYDVDPIFHGFDHLTSNLVYDVWNDKYRFQLEGWEDMCERVSKAVFEKDADDKKALFASLTADAMNKCLWMPAGRILAGAGTAKRVTLMNCFVNAKLDDSMESITDALKHTMLTQQQGGGIGTDFSPIRPAKAQLFRTGATASGPGPFIDTFDSAGTTIRSAGDRRGAQMGTLICTHPFLPDFIKAKQEKGRWTNFNVSVLVTDAFMAAVDEDEDWYLHHQAVPGFPREPFLMDKDFEDEDGVMQYVYSVHKARELWDQILRSTYDYAEPGVIFIDRVNDLNNLNYIEDIQCTNPCGEQPLPPHGCCNLGAVNVSRMITKPFTEDADFNWELLRNIVALGVRFLDNVIDVTGYPLPEQEEEERNKRRIGLGVTGLADAMHMLGMRYGSPSSVRFAERIMQTIAIQAYQASVALAKEKGSFPLFDAKQLLERPFIKQLPEDIRADIKKGYLRNGVLLTIAPTGTTSIAFGNGSSGLEPVFMHETQRNVTQPDGTRKPYVEYGFGAKIWMKLFPDEAASLPGYMNTMADVKIHEHIKIQEVCQRWVDASISKTINLPADITFEHFREVYSMAYTAGLKGCTTYRPSDIRGSILQAPEEVTTQEAAATTESKPAALVRPETIDSRTVKVRWPGLKSALYLTIGYVDGKPFEVFLNSKDQSAMEWMTSTTLLMSMVLRQGLPMDTLADEFKQIHALEGGWVDGHYHPSLISYLGQKLREMVTLAPTALGAASPTWVGHIDANKNLVFKHTSALTKEDLNPSFTEDVRMAGNGSAKPKASCKQCGSYNVSVLGGCPTCNDCGWSKCQ